MDERINKWLFDIKKAIDEINSFFPSNKREFSVYKKDIMLKRAVERELEIIGEAVNRIIKRNSSYSDKISDSVNIIGLRNQVIHAYDNISDENIWAIIINHLPQLEKDIKILLNE